MSIMPSPISRIDETELEILKETVVNALDLSYCPYSKFRVGCVVLTESGEFFQGANVENASYGASICAERTTITQAVLKGHRSIKAIAICSDLTSEFITPCGICRQVIREFGTDIPIYMFKPDGTFNLSNISELLPMSFGPEQLQ